MTDQELANKCVAFGVGRQGKYPLSSDGVGFYQTPGDESDGLCAELFVRSWLVAGPMMEKYFSGPYAVLDDVVPNGLGPWDARESLPRAIIEKCVGH